MAVKKRQNKERLQIYPKRKKRSLFFIKKATFLFAFPSGIVNFASKASKRREGIHFFISSDKYLILMYPIVGYADTFSEGESKKNSDIF